MIDYYKPLLISVALLFAILMALVLFGRN